MLTYWSFNLFDLYGCKAKNSTRHEISFQTRYMFGWRVGFWELSLGTFYSQNPFIPHWFLPLSLSPFLFSFYFHGQVLQKISWRNIACVVFVLWDICLMMQIRIEFLYVLLAPCLFSLSAIPAYPFSCLAIQLLIRSIRCFRHTK